MVSIYIVVQQTSGTFSSCETETLYSLNMNSPSSLPQAPGNHLSTCHFGLNIRSLQQWQREYRFEEGTTTITEISQKHKTIAQTKYVRGQDQNSMRNNEDEYI